jgi:peroxiredoxin
MSTNLSQLPKDLPAPVDDGAASHLEGSLLPKLMLNSTDGASVNLSDLRGRWVIYIYPMTGRPDVPLPDGWDGIPGARGCTPQSCSFRDHYKELKELGASVFGLSAQTSDYQREARDRLHLPFQLLSDSSLQLKDALQLPTFTVGSMELFKRLTLIAEDGRIRKVFYPVFPPDRNADDVLACLRSDAQPGAAGDALQAACPSTLRWADRKLSRAARMEPIKP